MKQITLLSKLFVLFAVVGFFASCEPEVLIDNPSVDLVDEAGFISAAATVNSGDSFKVKLSADQGTAEMTTLTVRKDGTNLSTDFFTIDGAIDNNPKLLFDGDRAGFTYEIEITTEGAGSSTYSFIVNADDTGSGSTSVEITSEDIAVDPILSNDMNSSIELQNPGTVQIVLTGVKGSSPLNTLAVFEEGVLITDNSRLTWGTVAFNDNPFVLTGTDKDGFTSKKLFLKSNNIIGETNYSITLADEAGNLSSITYKITILPIGTDLGTLYTNITVFNNAGAMFGGLDLDSGTNVSSTNASADLIDSGNDTNGNWKMQIKKSGSASLRSIDGSFTYASVTTVEALQLAYDGGTELVETGTIVVGSTYAAQANGSVYIFTVTEVNDTSGNNNDNYVISMKGA